MDTMENRLCKHCDEIKPLSEYHIHGSTGKPRGVCKPCKNKQANAYRICWRNGLHMKIIRYLEAHPCVDCGESDILFLEFDHVGDKLGSVTELLHSNNWKRIEKEIEKCVVRCISCHRLKSRKAAGVLETKGRLLKAEYARDKGCVQCGETNIDLLDFDHLNDKEVDMASLVKRKKISRERFLKEANKCQLLCCKCHKKKTAHDFGNFKLKYQQVGLELTFKTIDLGDKCGNIGRRCRICFYTKDISEFAYRRDTKKYRTECISCSSDVKKAKYRQRKQFDSNRTIQKF